MNKAPFVDLSSLVEADRIKTIGEQAAAGKVVGVCLERDDKAKRRRYIDGVTKQFPTVRVIATIDGPTAGVVTLQFGPRGS